MTEKKKKSEVANLTPKVKPKKTRRKTVSSLTKVKCTKSNGKKATLPKNIDKSPPR